MSVQEKKIQICIEEQDKHIRKVVTAKMKNYFEEIQLINCMTLFEKIIFIVQT
jgi:hypothetical protein